MYPTIQVRRKSASGHHWDARVSKPEKDARFLENGANTHFSISHIEGRTLEVGAKMAVQAHVILG